MDTSIPSDPLVDADCMTSTHTSHDSNVAPPHQPKKRQPRKKSAIVESAHMPSETISTDKSTECELNSQPTESSRTSARESTSDARGLDASWMRHVSDLLKKLWLPIETDSADLHSNSSSGSWKKMESKSWFSIQEWTANQLHAQNSQMTCSPSSTFSIAESKVKSRTNTGQVKTKKSGAPVPNRSRKYRLLVTTVQKSKLKQWLGCNRMTYNLALNYCRNNDSTAINQYALRDRFVTADGEGIQNYKFLLSTPKAIREGAIRDVVNAYTSNFAIKKKNPSHKFRINFRSKKDPNQTMNVDSSSEPEIMYDPELKTCSLRMFPKFLGDECKFKIGIRNCDIRKKKVPVITSDIRITMDRMKNFYVHIPFVQMPRETQAGKNTWVALDPGCRVFQTMYSPMMHKAIQFGPGDSSMLYSRCVAIDRFCSSISKCKKEIRKCTDKRTKRKLECKSTRMTRAKYRMAKRIKCMVDEIQWKTIHYLVKNFRHIIIPEFKTSSMVDKRDRHITRKTVRQMLTWSHYTFRMRLMEKARFSGTTVYVVTEEYTSKTCGNCFNIHDKLGSSKIFNCPTCSVKMDRDLNGSRNIFIKNVELVETTQSG